MVFLEVAGWFLLSVLGGFLVGAIMLNFDGE